MILSIPSQFLPNKQKRNIFTFGVGIKYKYLNIGWTIMLNDIKTQIEKMHVDVGENSVNG